MYNCPQSLLARRCTQNGLCRLQAESTFETQHQCWTKVMDKSYIAASCHDTCLPKPVSLVLQAGFWLHLRERSVCSCKHIKGLLGVHTQGATASGAGQDPSPVASSDSSDSTSGGDGSPMPETQANSQSPGSGSRTSSGAGAHETMPTGQGLAASVPASTGKAKAKKVIFSAVYTCCTRSPCILWQSQKGKLIFLSMCVDCAHMTCANSECSAVWLVRALTSSLCLVSLNG